MAGNKFDPIICHVDTLYADGHNLNKIAYLLDLKVNQVKYILYQKLKVQQIKPRSIFSDSLLEDMPRIQVSRCLTLARYGYTPNDISKDQKIPLCRVVKLLNEAQAKKII